MEKEYTLDTIIVVKTVITGIGATLIMDLWSFGQKYLLKLPPLNYALVGRWIAWLFRGKLCHNTIASTPALRGESVIGWVFHYLTGIVFAMLLVGFKGVEWLSHPTLIPALATGLISVVAPFFILQPAFGLGIAASRTAAPRVARRRSVITHLTFGLGLFVAGWLVLFFYPVQA